MSKVFLEKLFQEQAPTPESPTLTDPADPETAKTTNNNRVSQGQSGSVLRGGTAESSSGHHDPDAAPSPPAIVGAIKEPADLPEDWLFDYEERLSIMIHDGKLARKEAEKWALICTIRKMRETPERSKCPCVNCRAS
jgi:hypothetical protein